MNGWLEIAVAMNAVRRFLFSALTEAFVSLRSGVLWMPPLHNLNQRQSALYPVSVCKVLTVPQLRDSGLFYRSLKKKIACGCCIKSHTAHRVLCIFFHVLNCALCT